MREWLWIGLLAGVGGQRAGGAARTCGAQGRGNGAARVGTGAAPGFRFGEMGSRGSLTGFS